MEKAIAYYRVSTGRQGRSGLGLDAQQSAVRQYCRNNGYTLLTEVVEVRSTRQHRAGLLSALDLCKENKATLVVARLDRLGRCVEQIAKLFNQRSKTEVKVADNPHANRFTIHILAAVAEDQRQRISDTTREALRAAKSRGVELGRHGKLFLSVANKQAAEDFARGMSPMIKKLRKRGIITGRAVCYELNKKGVPTFRSVGKWHPSSVHTLLTRINNQEKRTHINQIAMQTTTYDDILFDDVATIISMEPTYSIERTPILYNDCDNRHDIDVRESLLVAASGYGDLVND